MNNSLYSHELKTQLSAQIDKICELVRSENLQHRTDLNDDLESIFCRVINTHKDLELRDLNAGSKQEAGIDLGDEKSKICYQVTAESTASKIHDCLDKFESGKMYEKYDRLVILFANDYMTKLDSLTLKKYSFDPKVVVVIANKNTFKTEIQKDCELEKLQKIVDYLGQELSPLIDNPAQSIGIINDILAQCVEAMKDQQLATKTTQDLPVHIKEKITLNFEDAGEADQVARYIRNALVYASTINDAINNYPDLDSSDLEEYMMDVYNRLESQNKKPMEILLEMFKRFTPPGKGEDLKYMSWSRRFVLKYFENCTIFKRSKHEVEQGVLL